MFARVLAFVAVFMFSTTCRASIAPNSGREHLFDLELVHHAVDGNQPKQTDVLHFLDVMSPSERRKLWSNPYVLAAIIAAAIAIPLAKIGDANNHQDTESQPESNKQSP